MSIFKERTLEGFKESWKNVLKVTEKKELKLYSFESKQIGIHSFYVMAYCLNDAKEAIIKKVKESEMNDPMFCLRLNDFDKYKITESYDPVVFNSQET